MKRAVQMKYIAMITLGLTLFACQTGGNSEKPAEEGTHARSNTESVQEEVKSGEDKAREVIKREPTAEDKAAREAYKETVKRIQQEKNNPTSVYKYLSTSPDFKVFGQLLKLSDWAKYVHNNEVTVFVPQDKYFKDYPDHHLMMKPENKELLNEFISNYITDTQLTFKTFKAETVINTKGDRSFKVDTKNGITLQGVEVKSGYIQVDNGTILELKGMPYYPSGLK